MEVELRRQIAQIFLGMVAVFSIIIFNRDLSLIFTGLILLWGMGMRIWVKKKGAPRYIKYLLDKFERDGLKKRSPGKGAMTLTIGIFLAIFLFSESIAIQSILVLSISDALATIIGKKYGKIKIINGKSAIGSSIFFVSALAIEMFFLNIFAALLIGVVVTLVELMPVDDNITIPLAVGFTLMLL